MAYKANVFAAIIPFSMAYKANIFTAIILFSMAYRMNVFTIIMHKYLKSRDVIVFEGISLLVKLDSYLPSFPYLQQGRMQYAWFS